MKTEEIEIEAIRLSIEKAVAIYEDMPPVQLTHILNAEGNKMVMRLHTAIWKRRVGETMVMCPKTWWQHFKSTFFPLWLLGIFPVDYDEIKFDIEVLYPEYRLVDPEMGKTNIIYRKVEA